MRIIKINSCGECRYLDFIGSSRVLICRKTKKSICKFKKVGEYIPIPDWCPLEKEENNERD